MKTALYELGFCFDISERMEEGKNYFQDFVDRTPYSYIGWYNLGITYSKLDLFEKAIDCYDFAIAIKEDFSSAYFNKAHCLNQQKKYEEALLVFNETLKFDTEDALCYHYMAESFEKLEEYTKAISFYKKAISFDEYLADSWYGIAACYFEMEKELDAIAYVRKAIKLDEFNPEYFYLLGEVQSELGFHNEALEAFETVYDLNPGKRLYFN